VSDAVTRQIVAFARVLREAGLEVGPGRLEHALAGLERLTLETEEDVYWTLRVTLVARREELELFDRAFRAWFLRGRVAAPARPADPDPRPRDVQRVRRDGARDGDAQAGDSSEVGWSRHELLRSKDFAAMTSEEFAAARRLMGEIVTKRPRRRSRRLRPHPRGRVLDLRRLARRSLATGGEPIDRRFRRRAQVPRKLVLLCDVSGSMEAYTRALLLFLHAAVRSGRGVEVFAFGTRLTRLTADLMARDPDQALESAARRVVDWASGTRIGAALKTFNDVWGRRALTRGAVVVIVSDGWERADVSLVSREMARLRRAAYAVIWVNPLKGSPQYQPLAGGMRAALPYVDRFVPGHNLASLEQLGTLLEGIERRHAA
jgi:uncharacterized protein